jgi:hypothetical protein
MILSSPLPTKLPTIVPPQMMPPSEIAGGPVQVVPWSTRRKGMVIALSLAILFAIITDRRDYDAATKAQSWSTRPDVNIDANTATNKDTKKNCQIIYVLGVEGATHHGFTPILEYLANSQMDEIGRPPPLQCHDVLSCTQIRTVWLARGLCFTINGI